jgi:prophage regulatory protein
MYLGGAEMSELLNRQVYYMSDVEIITGKNRLTIRRWWEKGCFPKPTKLNNSLLAWNVSTIQDWIKQQIPE